jgi:hypothetical protein
MCGDIRADGIKIRSETGGDERLERRQNERRVSRAVPCEHVGHVHMAAIDRLVVQRALPIAAAGPRRGVRIRVVREAPLGQLDIVVLDRDVQIPAGARPVAALIEHHPLGILPVFRASDPEAVRVDRLKEPQRAAVEVDVVANLHVVRFGAAVEQQADERIEPRMPGAALFALADDADERRVLAAPGHEVRVGICAVIEQGRGNRDGIVGDALHRQPREAEIRQWLPALRAPVTFDEVVLAARIGPLRVGIAVAARRPARIVCQRTRDRPEIAADDGCVEVGAGNRGVALEQPHRGVRGTHVIGPAAHVMIRTRVVEEARHRVRRCASGRDAQLQPLFQIRPSGETEFARQRQLHGAQRRRCDGLRQRALEASARVRIAGVKRLQPALRFLLQTVKGEIGRETSWHDLPPKMPEVR